MQKKNDSKFLYFAARIMLGKSMADSIVAAEGRIRSGRFRKTRARRKFLRTKFRDSRSLLEDLSRTCMQHLSPVTEPLVLISQIQRSGGTLLSRLFDGHPQLHAHPYELKIGYPKKYFWPVLDLNDSPTLWFEILFEDIVLRLFREGYRKERSAETFPFIFLPGLQKEIFIRYLETIHPVTRRDIFNAYMTSFFGAWLNNHNVSETKKFVTGFTPRLTMKNDNVEAFFTVYPDGRLISIVRDPKNWYPSALGHSAKIKNDKYGNLDMALAQWKDSAGAMLRNKKAFGSRVCIIRFEDLVTQTASVMRFLCNFLEIEFDEILLTPTFNRNLISANTSFGPEKEKIVQSTLYRYKTLSPEDRHRIEDQTAEVYRKLLRETAEV